jgi:hypothetical protein
MVVGTCSNPAYDPLLTRTSLFPLAPLALELPQYIRQEPFFYASTATQTTYSLYSYCLALRDISAEVGSKEEHTFFVVLSMLLLLAQIMVYASIWNHRFPPGPASRAGVNVLYLGYLMVSMVPIAFYIFSWTWAELNWFTRCVFLVRCVNASVFGIAALLYGIAWTRQHTWVSSRSLGGTGIEPMVLMMPGRGPLYQSIGNEVGEGVIRLV